MTRPSDPTPELTRVVAEAYETVRRAGGAWSAEMVYQQAMIRADRFALDGRVLAFAVRAAVDREDRRLSRASELPTQEEMFGEGVNLDEAVLPIGGGWRVNLLSANREHLMTWLDQRLTNLDRVHAAAAQDRQRVFDWLKDMPDLATTVADVIAKRCGRAV